MLSNSAFVTVGESRKTVDAMAAHTHPRGEYSILRECFSKTVAQIETPHPPGTFAGDFRFAVKAQFATWHTDNVYLGEEFPGIQFLALEAIRPKERRRIVMLIHNVSSLKRVLPLTALRLGRLVDHFLCLSERSRAELRSRYGVSDSRITVVNSRVDTDFFRPDPSVQIERMVSSAGAINRDFDTLIEAVVPLGVTTKIAADTAWRYSAKTERRRTLPESVEMRSWGTYLNLRALYARSAVVVVPLHREMLSGVTVALEAMAMGRPVILTRNPYVEDFIADGETGFFVPAHDAGALRARISELLEDPHRAVEMGARARKWVEEHFSLERYVSRILSAWG